MTKKLLVDTAMPAAAPSPDQPKAGHRLSALFEDADLVDRVFDYMLELMPDLARRGAEFTDQVPGIKAALRREFYACDVPLRSPRHDEREQQARDLLKIFNGRNATEAARRLGLSRATVYRMLKQRGGR